MSGQGADCILYLVRHGESEQNAAGDKIGQTAECPLTDLGRKQAALLGGFFLAQDLKFDQIYSSTYVRAKNTCALICQILRQGYSTHEELREYFAGEALGKPRAEYINPATIPAMDELGMRYKFPGGESLYEVQTRVIDWLSQQPLAGKVLVVGHGQVIKTILHHVLDFDERLTWRVTIDNTSISILERRSEQWFLKGINLTPHLPGKPLC